MNKNKVLILGDGFLGSEFIRHGFIYYTSRKPYKKTLAFDANDRFNIQRNLQTLYNELHFDTIINCIGCANTRYCEDPKNFNYIKWINGEFVHYLGDWCHTYNIKLVHISTGCLYDNVGRGTVKETDFIAAHCNYVVSKWIGEYGCNIEKDLVIRPRLYFSDIINPLNLICKFPKFKTILNEFNSVTSTRTIVEAVTALLKNNQTGIFNVANDGAYTIKQLSEAIGYKWNNEQIVSQEELHKSQGLYLVNNVMDLSKLKQFYSPRDAVEEFKWCKQNLHEAE